MTPAEHAQQKAWVIASEMLQTTSAQRHGVYRNRKALAPVVPLAVAVAAVALHVYVLPTVTERRPL